MINFDKLSLTIDDKIYCIINGITMIFRMTTVGRSDFYPRFHLEHGSYFTLNICCAIVVFKFLTTLFTFSIYYLMPFTG